MKVLTRSLAPLTLALGVLGALAAAPAAGASPTRPTVQTTSFATSIGITSPCDDSFVSTTGTGYVATVTSGQHTLVGWYDNESGDGYHVYSVLVKGFGALASSYTGLTNISFIDTADLAQSFTVTEDQTIYVNATNAPTGSFITGVVSESCGL